MAKDKIIVKGEILDQEKKNSQTFLLKKNYLYKNLSEFKEEDNILLLEKKLSKLNLNDKYKQENVLKIDKDKFLLRINNVSKSLGKKPILKNISLSLKPGSVVGLLGPNGSGKTTLFNLIIGKIFPDKGNIIFNNEEIQNLPIHERSLRGLSLLEQHKGLFGNMTAGDNLYAILQLHIKEKEKINQRIDELLSYFNLEYLKDFKTNNLSGGEYKKVSILQRICNPRISTILLDEPCAALDPLSINSLKKFILELKRIGLTVLITDHNYWAIENILDKAYLIKDGQILVEGTTEKISKDENAIKYYLGGNFRI